MLFGQKKFRCWGFRGVARSLARSSQPPKGLWVSQRQHTTTGFSMVGKRSQLSCKCNFHPTPPTFLGHPPIIASNPALHVPTYSPPLIRIPKNINLHPDYTIFQALFKGMQGCYLKPGARNNVVVGVFFAFCCIPYHRLSYKPLKRDG